MGLFMISWYRTDQKHAPFAIGPWTQTRPLKAAQIWDINMDSGGSTYHSYQYGPWQ